MLAIYTSLAAAEVSTDGSYSNPLKWFVPLAGSTQTTQLFMKSDSTTSEAFSNIVVSCQDTQTPDESSWFQFATDNNGAPNAFTTGRLSLGSLAFGSSLPFWVQLQVPAQTNYGSLNRFRVFVNYTLN